MNELKISKSLNTLLVFCAPSTHRRIFSQSNSLDLIGKDNKVDEVEKEEYKHDRSFRTLGKEGEKPQKKATEKKTRRRR